jgi:hypothetical protein
VVMSLLCEDMIPIVAQPSSLRNGDLDRCNHALQPIALCRISCASQQHAGQQ